MRGRTRPFQSWRRRLKEANSLPPINCRSYQLTIEEGTPFYGCTGPGKLDSSRMAKLPPNSKRADPAGLRDPRAARPTRFPKPAAPAPRAGTISPTGAMVTMPGSALAPMAGCSPRKARSPPRPNVALKKWLELVAANGHGMIETSELSLSEQADELLLMGLRLREGIDLKRWSALSGRMLDAERTGFLISHGMIEQMGPDRIRCTPEGMLVL